MRKVKHIKEKLTILCTVITAPLKPEVKTDLKKILVVDDEEFMLFAMRHKLQNSGFEVMTAHNGFEAINRVEKERPDLILLDIMMPYVSGLEFLNWVRTQYGDSKIPVVIISTLDQDEVIKVGYDLGATHYLKKPFDMDDLVDTVNK